METSIAEAELAERPPEIVDRVRRGEQFVVVRDGEAVAVLGRPLHPKLSSAVLGVAERLRGIGRYYWVSTPESAVSTGSVK